MGIDHDQFFFTIAVSNALIANRLYFLWQNLNFLENSLALKRLNINGKPTV